MSDLWSKATDLWEDDSKAAWNKAYPGKPYENQIILRRSPPSEQNRYLKKAAAELGLGKEELRPWLL